MTRSVFIIDPRSDIDAMVSKARDFSGDKGYIYFPHTKKQTAIADSLRNTGSTMTLIPYDTINSDIDDELFGFCQQVALNASRGVPEKSLRWSFYVLLQEHIVAELRRAEQLRYVLAGHKVKETYWLSTVHSATCRDVIMAAFPRTIDLTGLRARPLSEAIGKIASGKSYNVLSGAQIDAVTDLAPGRKTVCVSTNMEDSRYREAVLPIVKTLLDREKNVVLLSARPAVPGQHESSLNEFGIRRSRNFLFLDQSEMTVRTPPNPTEILFIIKRAAPETDFSAYEAIYGGVVRDIVAVSSLSLLAQCRASWPRAKALARASDAILLSPGRPLRSTLLAAAAKEIGRPTIELQSGTLSRNRRFIAPVADQLLVIDDESKQTYAYLGRTRRVSVIGGTKIDYALAPYRNMTMAAAREKMGLPKSGIVWMLASQPVGVSRMQKIAGTVFAAANKIGAMVVVKMHPNENSVYEETYRRLAGDYPESSIIIDRETKAPLAIVASDAVFTHFSTVGLESHILGKLTIAVNPFKEKVIFDIAAMGAAHAARTSRDILDIVRNKGPLKSENSTLTDGRSIERCVAVVERLLAAVKAETKAVEAPSEGGQLLAPHVVRPEPMESPHWLQLVWRTLPRWARVGARPIARHVKKLVIRGAPRKLVIRA